MKQVTINLYLENEPNTAELADKLDEVKYFAEKGYLFGEGWNIEIKEL